MRLVVELSRLNVERGTGGPFGAEVFEIVAIMIAQQVVGASISAATASRPTSCWRAPSLARCASARRRGAGLGGSCAARATRTWAFGFDEGTKLCEWAFAREECGISVERDVLR
jgi:hypothetical protein